MGQKNRNNVRFTSIKNTLIDMIISEGRKETSEIIFKKSLKTIQKGVFKRTKSFLRLFVINSIPLILLKNKNSSIQIPYFLNSKYRTKYSIKHIVKILRAQKHKSFYLKLSDEIIDLKKKKGSVFEFKNERHKNSFLKKKTAHYRWF